jgi:hypothetical protein
MRMDKSLPWLPLRFRIIGAILEVAVEKKPLA